LDTKIHEWKKRNISGSPALFSAAIYFHSKSLKGKEGEKIK